ncbi:uncharacterized protein LOC143615423 [Bidens hawaiensis]|uniref:uncharacterized protein LOC143615423 n=1 Tax=Bidens hawaiensis TaxID=980011 RepID=UPI004049BFDC
MGGQKHGSKGGGYVGGFLHLFDWNAKSRKKLFSSKSESPEQPKQTKRTDGNMPMTRFNMMEEDDMIRDYSCATSVTDEDGYGTKAPGVVARLMGLDSLPTANFSDTYSNPSFDSQSLKGSSTNNIREDPELEMIDSQMETVFRATEVRPQKMLTSRAIEKFQTETLPPKSAKPIPITRNKLLSPIKTSGFVSSNNPARIMEAASKIPIVRSTSPSPSSSSTVPFRVKVSRDKVENSTRKPNIPEPARKPSESNVKNLKSQNLEPKKSVSLAFQAKANVQKRDGLTHRAQPVRTQSNTERNPQKNAVSSNVLKQNNQKQNSLVDRGKSTPKPSNVGPQARKPALQKSSHKKEPYSTARKKRAIEDSDRNNNSNNNNGVRERGFRSNRSDVVSFTFTAPIACPGISNNAVFNGQSKNAPGLTNNDSNSSSLTSNAITGDALSTLLEQKLRELTGSPASVSQDSSYGFSAINPDPDLMNTDDSSYGLSVNEPREHDYAYRKYLFGREPSPDSGLEPSPSFITESCNSSDTAASCKQDSASVQARELTAAKLLTNPTPMDVDTELLDSACSITTVTKWESDYVKDVLADIETMFVDFTIGKSRKIVNPRVFDQLELGRVNEEVVKLRRELVFNCVSECVETRCRVWANALATVKRPDKLAREVYEEIVGWEDMRDSMVDELVDKDMSGSGYKKWLDFDEGFEIGFEIEARLIDSLINEVVDDILVL